MVHVQPRFEVSRSAKLSREWHRIRRQVSRFVTAILTYPRRRKFLIPLRRHKQRYLSIPPETLPAQLAARFASISLNTPRISIIIPVFNQFAFTARCLLSLADHEVESPFEIIVVDDGSSDPTESVLSELPGLRYHRSNTNVGFVDSCNVGAQLAVGTYLVFLNNDTLVFPEWLNALEHTFSACEDCGLVGSMLFYPNLILQDAGGLVFRDGSAANRGKGESIGDPEFNDLRPVDYCSGASIMISKELFKNIGGFDTRYRPAYFEDTDLGFSVRQAGFKVYFQPASKVIHFEGVTAGRNLSKGVKAYQVAHRHLFLEKWGDTLARQPERTTRRHKRFS